MKTKYFVGMNLPKENTVYAVRNLKGDILLEGETATLYSELHERLRPYLASAVIGLEASTSYYSMYRKFLGRGYNRWQKNDSYLLD